MRAPNSLAGQRWLSVTSPLNGRTWTLDTTTRKPGRYFGASRRTKSDRVSLSVTAPRVEESVSTSVDEPESVDVETSVRESDSFQVSPSEPAETAE